MITVKTFLELVEKHGVSNLDDIIAGCHQLCLLWTAKRIYNQKSKPEKDWDTALQEAHSIVQDAILISLEKAAHQKINPSNAKLSTYLMSICINLLRNEKPPFLKLSTVEEVDDKEDEEEKEKTLNQLQKCMDKLEPKRKDLVLGFNDGKSHRELAAELDYKNENVAKSSYHSAIQQLKKCMKGFFIP